MIQLVAVSAFLLLSILFPFSMQAQLSSTGFDLKEHFGPFEGCLVLNDFKRGTSLRYNQQMCEREFSPCSTFKIPNSLIALETGAIQSANEVIQWDGTDRGRPEWNKDQTLASAFKVSAVWFYQELARRIGIERMKKYLDAFNYGNCDVSGGVDTFWLDSSLRISANQQINFLRKLLMRRLKLSERTYDIMADVMVVGKNGEWILRGKTGTGGTMTNGIMENRTLSWFVGYVSNGEQTYIFACNVSGDHIPDEYTARNIVERVLKEREIY